MQSSQHTAHVLQACDHLSAVGSCCPGYKLTSAVNLLLGLITGEDRLHADFRCNALTQMTRHVTVVLVTGCRHAPSTIIVGFTTPAAFAASCVSMLPQSTHSCSTCALFDRCWSVSQPHQTLGLYKFFKGRKTVDVGHTRSKLRNTTLRKKA